MIRMTEFKFEDEYLRLVSIQDIQTELDEQELISWQRLIRVLNHEVMNSLTPIRTLSHATRLSVEQSGLDTGKGKTKQLVEDIQKNTRLIEERSAGLMEFVKKYRDITSIQELEINTFLLKDLLDKITQYFSEECKSRKIKCNLQIEPEQMELSGDQNFLEQVFINLVRNSIEALENTDNPEINLQASRNSDGQAVIHIHDNGQGIPPEILDDIFTPFFTTKESGSGIGLSFARHIIRLHNGSISLTSEPNVETVITLKF